MTCSQLSISMFFMSIGQKLRYRVSIQVNWRVTLRCRSNWFVADQKSKLERTWGPSSCCLWSSLLSHLKKHNLLQNCKFIKWFRFRRRFFFAETLRPTQTRFHKTKLVKLLRSPLNMPSNHLSTQKKAASKKKICMSGSARKQWIKLQ